MTEPTWTNIAPGILIILAALTAMLAFSAVAQEEGPDCYRFVPHHGQLFQENGRPHYWVIIGDEDPGADIDQTFDQWTVDGWSPAGLKLYRNQITVVEISAIWCGGYIAKIRREPDHGQIMIGGL